MPEQDATPELPEDVTPAVEDASQPEAVAEVTEDEDLAPLDNASALMEADGAEGEVAPPPSSVVERDDVSDTDTIPDDLLVADDTPRLPDWTNENSAHRIAVELKHIEKEVRLLLEANDPRRKRRLSGSRRWFELQQDLLSWQGGGRIDEETRSTVHRLVVKRHYLFQRLRYLAATRSGWTT